VAAIWAATSHLQPTWCGLGCLGVRRTGSCQDPVRRDLVPAAVWSNRDLFATRDPGAQVWYGSVCAQM
jgi:hypothetical protein